MAGGTKLAMKRTKPAKAKKSSKKSPMKKSKKA